MRSREVRTQLCVSTWSFPGTRAVGVALLVSVCACQASHAAFVGVIGSSSRLQLEVRTNINDASTHRVFTSPVASTTLWEGVTMGPDGALYAADLIGQRFVRFDPATESFTELSPLGLGCRDMAWDPVTSQMLFLDTTRRIHTIDPSTSTLTLVGTISGTTTNVWGLSVAADGTRYALATSGQLYQLNGLQASLVRTYSGFSNGLAIDWTGSNRYFATADSGTFLRELSTTSTTTSPVSGFGSLDGGAFFPAPSTFAPLCLLAWASRRRRTLR